MGREARARERSQVQGHTFNRGQRFTHRGQVVGYELVGSGNAPTLTPPVLVSIPNPPPEPDPPDFQPGIDAESSPCYDGPVVVGPSPESIVNPFTQQEREHRDHPVVVVTRPRTQGVMAIAALLALAGGLGPMAPLPRRKDRKDGSDGDDDR